MTLNPPVVSRKLLRNETSGMNSWVLRWRPVDVSMVRVGS